MNELIEEFDPDEGTEEIEQVSPDVEDGDELGEPDSSLLDYPPELEGVADEVPDEEDDEPVQVVIA